jgi:NAD(P)-dependent dehydrogenase (short-subunit alcohol dehydrogenase family)
MAKVVTALRSATEKAVSAGKVALITGGTSGIGGATARRMAELGAKVVISGRRQREGRLLVGDIRRNGGCAVFFRTDLSRSDEARRIVPFTIETFGRLDYAFNNAGISGDNRLLVDQTEENFDRVFAVNVKALFLLLQDEVKQMLAQGCGGSIVNAASVAGLLATPTAGPYVASKHAVLGLTKTAAVEYGDTVFGSTQSVPVPCARRCCSLSLGVRKSTGWARSIPLAASGDQRRLPTPLHGSFRTNPHISLASR